jgi:16S rRNA (adenine1518-N6/adenine1519-N6)-dimethyltransferase
VTLTRNEARELMERHGLSPRRAFGQNFVVDPNTVRRIARLAAVGDGDRVIEIGPGLGSLTRALMDTAVEVDRGLVPVLRAELPELTVVEADAMSADWTEILGSDAGWILVANLPYNVATPLVCDLLDGVPQISRMLVMVQREVAERMCASPSTPAYGAVSVKVAYWGNAKIAGHVPATVFMPQPKVESSLVAIERLDAPRVASDRTVLFELIRTGFGQRRKMLRRSLAGRVEPESFERAGIRPEARAEELDVYAWGRLTDAVLATRTK